MYSVRGRLALLYRRLAQENETLLSLLREGHSLARAEEILDARAEHHREKCPPVPGTPLRGI